MILACGWCFNSQWPTVSKRGSVWGYMSSRPHTCFCIICVLLIVCLFLHFAFTVFSACSDYFMLFVCVLQTWSTAPMSWTSASPTWQTHCWSAQPATAGLWFSKRSSPHTTSWCTATRWAEHTKCMDAQRGQTYLFFKKCFLPRK